MRVVGELEKAIREFLAFVIDGESDSEEEDIRRLIAALDKLAYSKAGLSYEFDDTDYPDPPGADTVTEEDIQKRFPTLGWYNVARNISKNIENHDMMCGDAIEDICDIAVQLSEVVWRFENTSNNDAMFFCIDTYSHWGRHLRELQLYLHDKCQREGWY